MKNLLIITTGILFMLSGFQATAQISEKEINMSLGKQNGFELNINSNDAGIVENLWKDFTREYGRFRTNRKANELYADQIKIPVINGKDKLDAYVKLIPGEAQTTLLLWIDLGTGFLSSTNHPDQYEKTMEWLMTFQFEAHRAIIEDELKGEEKMLSKQERELNQLKNDQEKYNKEIARAEETIRTMEENIKQNEINQLSSEKVISEQKEKINAVKEKLEKLKKEHS